jgi:Protein of unknown function (DUF642)
VLREKGEAIIRNRCLGWLCVLSTLLLGFPSAPACADLISNGSFENPPLLGGYEYVPGGMTTILGWQTILTGVERFDPHIYSAGAAQDGSLALDLNTDHGVGGGIQQTFPTSVGNFYSLSFFAGTWLAAGRDGTGHIEVLVDGSSHTFTVTNLTGTIVWTRFSITFQATATYTTLVFRNFDAPLQTFSLIDDVSVVSGSPPPDQCQSDLANGLSRIEQDFQRIFNDRGFAIPGATEQEKFQRLVDAILRLNKGRKEGLYEKLRGEPNDGEPEN